ncbi:hypothetical protein HY625_01495 [Candidatus Uhrbacteria bacterium]|nr:hypothetical protein [Candidatus Uhrbacteria bacterium]
MQKKFVLKKDIYRENRGGYSRFLNIFCDSCKTHLCLYQKDGPGELKRMYLDRIVASKVSPNRHSEFLCRSCKKIIGTLYIYQKEKRRAVRLYQGAIFKKVSIGIYPPSQR